MTKTNPTAHGAALPHAYSEEAVEAVLAAIGEGASVVEIGKRPGMPTGTTIRRWARQRPAFKARLDAARERALAEAKAANRQALVSLAFGKPGRPRVYDEDTAAGVLAAYADGWSLKAICALPGMPSRSTVHDWKKERPEFGEAYEKAEVLRAMGFVDDMGELAQTVTEETAASGRLKFAIWSRLASWLAPWKFGPKAEAAEPVTWAMPSFRVMTQEADGTWIRVPQVGEPGFETWQESYRESGEAFRQRYGEERQRLIRAGVTDERLDRTATALARWSLKAKGAGVEA